MERRNFAADPIAVGNNLLYLETDTERILFDTGNGPSDDGSGVGFLLPSLAAQGIPADSITTVCITHGHPDHVSGLVVDSNGTKAFPAATVYVPRVEFEYWMGQPGTPAEEIFDLVRARLGCFWASGGFRKTHRVWAPERWSLSKFEANADLEVAATRPHRCYTITYR